MTHPTLRKIVQSVLLAGIMLGAFRLSFDAQRTLAIASGIEADIAWIYPCIVDAAILTGVLVDVWSPELSRRVLGWVYAAVAFWTITNVLGNAVHVIALPPDRITVPMWLAIAVNTIPGITLFLAIHLSRIRLVDRKQPTPAKPARARPTATVKVEPITPTRQDIPPTTDLELFAMHDDGMSMSAIAAQVGRSKSYVGAAVKRLNDEREQASA